MSKPTHLAAKIRKDGAVSPLCAKQPRAINLGRATWTLNVDTVTCRACRDAWRRRQERSER